MWKTNPFCAICAEPKHFHDRKDRCRFEQPGWLPMDKDKPPLRHRVMARRGHQVFIAFRKIESIPIGEPGVEWVMPYCDQEGKEWHGIVQDIDGWREIKPIDRI